VVADENVQIAADRGGYRQAQEQDRDERREESHGGVGYF